MDAYNTVCENCPFVKIGACKTVQECPNYCENVWKNGQTQEVKIVKDCAPKRQLMMSQHTNSRVEQLQKAVESLRNRNEMLESALNALILQSQSVIKSIEAKLSQETPKITSQEVLDATDV